MIEDQGHLVRYSAPISSEGLGNGWEPRTVKHRRISKCGRIMDTGLLGDSKGAQMGIFDSDIRDNLHKKVKKVPYWP